MHHRVGCARMHKRRRRRGVKKFKREIYFFIPLMATMHFDHGWSHQVTSNNVAYFGFSLIFIQNLDREEISKLDISSSRL